MSRALNDELAGGVATKDDLDRAVDELGGEIARVDAKVGALDGKVGALDTKVGVLDAKVDAIDAKFDHQGRNVFLVLALIAALGLYNAVAPHMSGGRAVKSEATPAAPAPFEVPATAR